MSINERIYIIDHLLNERRSIALQELLDRLEVSPSTLKRDIAYMRDRLNAPIIFDKELSGYRFIEKGIGRKFELPGLWLNEGEIHALLIMQHLLNNLETGGLLEGYIKPLLSRLTAILGTTHNDTDEVQKRIKIEVPSASRQAPLVQFQVVGTALLHRKRLIIEYHSRASDEPSTREVSPQRLTHYRGNWYLDTWCHVKNAMRNFSVDSIKKAEITEKVAVDIDENLLNNVLATSYGIFSGSDLHWATLHFTAERAKWIADEHWHLKQKGKLLLDGTYELKVPYTDHRELIMDILKHGEYVTVTAPESLRNVVLDSLQASMKNYLNKKLD
ncbi:MAG: YafY family protein [Methylotenera sp.]|nr:YafY family protein [Methylotenera sp.]MDP1755775.1 YafY family protein [Methylotenera sp.]MDP1958792.1 YafY family protein [Methylotenera sp.]MDP3302631.1 YafY family protein [Methylotenera sp.]MDP3943365.1 YafY family protein [Methylotenera sp.]